MPIQHLLSAAVVVCALAHASSEKPCEDQTTCESDISSLDGLRSSAMLQVKIEPTKTELSSSSLKKEKVEARTRNDKSLSAAKAYQLYQHGRCVPVKMELHHIKESKDCISVKLMEAHLKFSHHAEFFAAKERDGGNLSLVERRQAPNVEEEELDPLSQFTKTEGGDIPSYCKKAYAGLHRQDASSPEECATECLKDRNCRHFMWHKGDISQAKCRLSHMCMVYTESKDAIDGYLLNVYTTTTTTTFKLEYYDDDHTVAAQDHTITKKTVADQDQELAENADKNDNIQLVNIGNEINTAKREQVGDLNIALSGADLRTKGKLEDDLDINDLSDDGSSLTLSSSKNLVPLWSMPVQDASCFSDNGDYTISGKFDYDRLTSDSDIQFGIHDGSSKLGITRCDHDGRYNQGTVQLFKGTWPEWGDQVDHKPLAVGDWADGHGTMTVTFDIAFSAGDDKGTVTITNHAGASVTFTKLANRLSFSKSISFFLTANNHNEVYRVHSIEISAPCPARTTTEAPTTTTTTTTEAPTRACTEFDNWRKNWLGVSVQIALTGQTAYGAKVASWEACLDMCRELPACKQVVYRKSTNECFGMNTAADEDQDGKGGSNVNYISAHCSLRNEPTTTTEAPATTTTTEASNAGDENDPVGGGDDDEVEEPPPTSQPPTFKNLGTGRCRDENGNLPAHYYKFGMTTEQCRQHCLSDIACDAFEQCFQRDDCCAIWGQNITSAPSGWTAKSGNGGGAITKTDGWSGATCMKKVIHLLDEKVVDPAPPTTTPEAYTLIGPGLFDCSEALRVYDGVSDNPGDSYEASVQACGMACAQQRPSVSGVTWETFGTADSFAVGKETYGEAMGRCYCTKTEDPTCPFRTESVPAQRNYSHFYNSYAIEAPNTTEAPNAGDENDPVDGGDDDKGDQEFSPVVGIDGASAPLNAAGFKEATSLCCPSEMEVFFMRLLDAQGYDVCSKPHIQGLMHWFTCVPDMDFQYVLDVIENGNPCVYWSKRGEECQPLSDKCAGKFCR